LGKSNVPDKDRSTELLDALNTISFSVQKLSGQLEEFSDLFESVMEMFTVVITNEASSRGMSTEEFIGQTLMRLGKSAFGFQDG
jgi:hypothetical protein